MSRIMYLCLTPLGILFCAHWVSQPLIADPPLQSKQATEAVGKTAQPTLSPPVPIEVDLLPIDLPTALRLANASNPTVAMARERVSQAYFRQRQAEVGWLPTLQAGPAYQRHDGLVQNATGNVFPTSKWNLFAGGGATLRMQLSDALFAPLITRRLTQAKAFEARTVAHNVQLDVALTYLDLLEIHGRLAVNAETLTNALEMMKMAEAAQEAGTGKTPADAPRARTEVYQRKVERRDLEALAGRTSARLAELLLLRPEVDLLPAETEVLPIQLVSADTALEELIALGMQNRPELGQGRSLADAAHLRWRQAKTDPFLPRLEVSYLAGEFGGGINSETIRFGGRGDGTVAAVWELHNLGAGEIARSRERHSLFQEANLHLVEARARVSAEIVAAAKLARSRQRMLGDAQKAVKEAQESWRRLRESSFGLGGRDKRYDPLEPLIAEQQLHTARNQYLAAVISFNKAQFQLFTALGSPAECGITEAVTISLGAPVLPSPPSAKNKK